MDGNSFLSRTPDQKPPLTQIFNSYLSFIHHILFIRKFCCLFKIYSKSNHFSSLCYYHLSLSHHHTYPLGHYKISLGPLSPPLPLLLYSLSSTQQPDWSLKIGSVQGTSVLKTLGWILSSPKTKNKIPLKTYRTLHDQPTAPFLLWQIFTPQPWSYSHTHNPFSQPPCGRQCTHHTPTAGPGTPPLDFCPTAPTYLCSNLTFNVVWMPEINKPPAKYIFQISNE